MGSSWGSWWISGGYESKLGGQYIKIVPSLYINLSIEKYYVSLQYACLEGGQEGVPDGSLENCRVF